MELLPLEGKEVSQVVFREEKGSIGGDGAIRPNDSERSDPSGPDYCVSKDRVFGGSVGLRRGGEQHLASLH